MGTLEDERWLLEDDCLENEGCGLYTGDGSVDINGKPALRKNTGNWKAYFFILATEICESMAYYGIATNLVTYLTKKLHQGNVSAARNITVWQGTCYLLPLIGAILADAYCGRYWTIAVSYTICMIVTWNVCFGSLSISSGFAAHKMFGFCVSIKFIFRISSILSWTLSDCTRGRWGQSMCFTVWCRSV